MENTSKKSMLTNTPLIPFILVTFLFYGWGVANNITEPLVNAFKTILNIPAAEASLVQFAFYIAYFILAIPAALLVRKTSYKTALVIGVGIYALGAFLFYPAGISGQFYFFLIALFILASGISIIETAANPYIIAMGDEETAVRRLNFAQCFNSVGATSGTFIATFVILTNITSSKAKEALSPEELVVAKTQDLSFITDLYIYIGIIAIIICIIILLRKMPSYQHNKEETQEGFFTIFARILKKRRYLFSVIALFLAMCAQFGGWTFTVSYLEELYMFDGALVSKGTAGYIFTGGTILFAVMRFVCTGWMKYTKPAKILAMMTGLGVVLSMIAITSPGNIGGVAVVLLSACFSLLFPTIYGLGLQGLSEEEIKVGASGLIMMILGASLTPLLQGSLYDAYSVNFSYIVVAVAFILLFIYSKNIEKYSNHDVK